MKSKFQKQTDALDRLETKLEQMCSVTDMKNYRLDSPEGYGFPRGPLRDLVIQCNDIRRKLNLPTLAISTYEWLRGNLVIELWRGTSLVDEFYFTKTNKNTKEN